LGRLVAALQVECEPHLAADDFQINIAEAEKGAGVIGLQEDNRAAIGAAATQIADQRRVTSKFGIERKIGDDAGATRHFQIQAAQRLAVEANDGADLDVEINVFVALRLAAGGSGERRLDEAAAIIDFAAQRYAQSSIRAAIRL